MTRGSARACFARLHLCAHTPRHAPLLHGRGAHTGRPGLLLGLEFARGGAPRQVWSEATPLPDFGDEPDDFELAAHELTHFDDDVVARWLEAPTADALDGVLSDTQTLRSGSARHALEWVAIEALAHLGRTAPAELLLDWLRRRSSPGAWSVLRQVIPTSAVLDLSESDVAHQARQLAEQGIFTWKLKCGRDRGIELAALRGLLALDVKARIRLDPGATWTLETATDFLEQAASSCDRGQLEFLEDPTPDPNEWATLAQFCPLAADEALTRPAASPGCTAYWVLKPMVQGVGRTLDLALRGAREGQSLVLSHTFDGPLALRTTTELACVLQQHDRAAGLGPHLGLQAWRELNPDAGRLLRGTLRAPPELEGGALLDGGHLGRALGAQPSGAASEPCGDALAPSRAARVFLDRPFLELDGSVHSFADWAREVEGATLPTSDFVPLIAQPKLASLVTLFTALERRVPVLLLHPSSPAEAQAALVDRCRQHAHELLPGDAVVVPTSGTTAEPRLVVHTRSTLLAALSASAARLGAPDPQARWLLSLPFAHVGGLSILLRCLAAGGSVVVSPWPNTPTDVAALLRSQRVTHLSLVPTQLGRLLEDPDFAFPESVRLVLVGGAHAPPSLRQSAMRRQVPVVYTYGLTELGSQVATERLGVRPVEDGGVGPPLPSVRLECDADGRLLIGGPMLMRRYLGEAMPGSEGPSGERRLATGDRGVMTAAGELRIEGRMDELIISGGENVSPQAVESVLLGVPGVRDVCVVGRPSVDWGQTVACAVVLDHGADEGETRPLLLALAREALPSFARPKSYHFLAALPRLPSGKVDRRQLALIIASQS